MPSRRAHRHYSRQMFGKDFDELHAALDAPSRWLGPNHRRLYHTYSDANALARLAIPVSAIRPACKAYLVRANPNVIIGTRAGKRKFPFYCPSRATPKTGRDPRPKRS